MSKYSRLKSACSHLAQFVYGDEFCAKTDKCDDGTFTAFVYSEDTEYAYTFGPTRESAMTTLLSNLLVEAESIKDNLDAAITNGYTVLPDSEDQATSPQEWSITFESIVANGRIQRSTKKAVVELKPGQWEARIHGAGFGSGETPRHAIHDLIVDIATNENDVCVGFSPC